MLGRIVNNKIEVGLPSGGDLADGTNVCNYQFLSPLILAQEGWREIIEMPIPLYDTETQFIIDTYTIQDNNIIHDYKIIEETLQ